VGLKLFDGAIDGSWEGALLAPALGAKDGHPLGTTDGRLLEVGCSVGVSEGLGDGAGLSVGNPVG
jgi:hypothetical protein